MNMNEAKAAVRNAAIIFIPFRVKGLDLTVVHITKKEANRLLKQMKHMKNLPVAELDAPGDSIAPKKKTVVIGA